MRSYLKSDELPKGAMQKGTRGAIVFRNDYGTVETNKVQHGWGTFFGTCIVDGKEHVRKMTGNKYDVRERWESWQHKVIKEYEDKKEGQTYMPDYTNALTKIASSIDKLTEKLDAVEKKMDDIAMAVLEATEKPKPNDSQSKEPKKGDGIDEFIKPMKWLDIINRTSKNIYMSLYIPFCKTNGYIASSQKKLTVALQKHFTGKLELKKMGGGDYIFRLAEEVD